jgi:hypothetical protein
LTWAWGQWLGELISAWRLILKNQAGGSVLSLTWEVHSYRRGLQEPPGDKRMKDHHAQVLDHLVAAKEINNSERS